MLPLAFLLALPPAAHALGHHDPLADDDSAERPLTDKEVYGLGSDTMVCLIMSDVDCAAGADATKKITRDSAHVPVAPPLFGDPKVFQSLLDAYHGGSVADVKASLGRSKEDWIENTCTIRLSFALNYAGIPGLPVDRSLVGAKRKINYITDKTDPQKGFAYIYRVDEFADYMLKKYGKPQIWAKKTDNPRTAVWGKKGIILFVVKGWDNATGHFDLWDGEKAAHEDYFDQATDVFLWQ